MRLSNIFAFFLVALAAAAAMAKDYEQVAPEDIFTGKQGRYGHLEYVGFFGSAMQHWDFTRELAPITNLTWVTTANTDLLISRLTEARDAGVQAVLSVQPFVFDSNYELRPDYLSSLIELQERIEAEQLNDTLAMIYPVDEPYHHANNSDSSDRESMYRDIMTVNADLEALFPGKPLGVIFNSREILRNDFRVPESYTWAGFDCYENMYDCKGDAFTLYYSTLLERLTAEQYMMAVPQTWIRYSDYERQPFEPSEIYEERLRLTIKQLKRRLRHHYELALAEPRIIAFIPFLWSLEPAPGKPDNSGFGADQFAENFPVGGSEFVDYLTRICSEIKTAGYKNPNVARRSTEFSLKRGPNKYQGGILDISTDGAVSAWSINWLLPHKALRMQVLLQRNGEHIYESTIMRSFILDRTLTPRGGNEPAAIGVHGYRHQLPPDLLAQLQGRSAVLKVRIYGDGKDKTFRTMKRKVFF